MKKNFKLAAIALAAFAMMAACNNNAPEEVVLDTTPIDTVVEEVIDTVVEEEEAPAVEATAAPAQKAPAKKKTTAEEIKEGVQTVKAASLQAKKDASEVAGELKKAGESVMNTTGSKPQADPLGAKKKPASEAFKK